MFHKHTFYDLQFNGIQHRTRIKNISSYKNVKPKQIQNHYLLCKQGFVLHPCSNIHTKHHPFHMRKNVI